MKKWCMVLILSALILSGCTKSAPPTEQPTESQSAAQSAEPLTREIVEYKTDCLPIYLSGSDRLLAVLERHEDDTTRLVTLDTSNGQVLAQKELGDDYFDLLVFSEGVAAWSWGDQTLRVYSDTLEPLWSMEFGPEGDGCLYGEDLFYFPKGGGEVQRLSLPDRSVQTCPCAENASPQEILLTQGGRSLLRSRAADTGEDIYQWIDWEEGTLGSASPPSRYRYMSRNSYYDVFQGDTATWLRSPVSDDVYKIEEKIDRVIQSRPDHLLGETPEHLLTVRDLKENRCVRHKTAGVNEALLCGDAVVYMEGDRPGIITIWTPSPEQWRESIAQKLTVQDISRENQEMIRAVTARTDIPVFCGAEGASYEMEGEGGYRSDPVTDELLIHVALEQLDRFTQECPEGFFREMCTEEFSPIEIYFGGTIWGDRYGAQPDGFTTFNEKAQIVVLDITNTLNVDTFRSIIAHEFLHVMENRVQNHSLETGLDYRSYWMSFVPDPDLYFYNYRDYQNYDKDPDDYTINGTQTPLFLDAYSRTLPTEDRARMFEQLYLGEKSEFYGRLRTGVLRQKAEYLCAVIRDSFPSCQIQGKLPWENGIDVVPIAELEDAIRSYVPVAVG